MTTQSHETTHALTVELGARIHELMWRKKISQGQMGAAIGVGQSTMSGKIRGRVPITVPELMAIAGVLGVDPGELLPRLDSNQQPSGYASLQVSGDPEGVTDLARWRRRRPRGLLRELRVLDTAAGWVPR